MSEGRLCIIDDVFPHPRAIDTWRGIEFEAYLEAFRNSNIITTLESIALLDKTQPNEVMEKYYSLYPNYSDRVLYDREKQYKNYLEADMLYFVFLNNAFQNIDFAEENNIPFVFELYPGGGFALNNYGSDKKLEKVTKSSCFKGVIVSSIVTKEYLLQKQMCSDDKILYVPGCVFNNDYKKQVIKEYYGHTKKTFDIAFAAYRYSEKGSDKGYDIFVETARQLHRISDLFRFHVIGNFDETIIDVKELKDYIFFYGIKESKWFDDFYTGIDVFVSPNKMSILNIGSFDGFPTGCAVDAMIRKCVLIVTDELNQNNGQYENGEEIFIVKPSVSLIVDRIMYLFSNSNDMIEVAIKGSDSAKIRYSKNNQLVPRVNFLKKTLDNILISNAGVTYE